MSYTIKATSFIRNKKAVPRRNFLLLLENTSNAHQIFSVAFLPQIP